MGKNMLVELGPQVPVANQRAAGLIKGEVGELVSTGRNFIINNRLPVTLIEISPGVYETRSTIGGAAAALLQSTGQKKGEGPRETIIIGYEDHAEDDGVQAAFNSMNDRNKMVSNVRFVPVAIPPDVYAKYYKDQSNRLMWGYQHKEAKKIELVDPQILEPAWQEESWRGYEQANIMFADRFLAEKPTDQDSLMISDYQVTRVAWHLRERGYKGRITFFLHIPFPPLEEFAKIPHHEDILKGLLAIDKIGFQTDDDRENFDKVASALTQKEGTAIKTKTETIPIGIDVEHFREMAKEPRIQQMAQEIRERFNGKRIIFTATRLDFVKGIPDFIYAYRRMRKHDENHDFDDTVVALATPKSRAGLPVYERYQVQFDRALETANKDYPGSVVNVGDPINGLSQEEMVAYYLAADVIAIPSHMDGFNLVSVEAVAANIDQAKKPAIFISKGAGASHLLKGTVQYDPSRLENLEGAMVNALNTSQEVRQAGAQINEQAIRDNDIHQWSKKLAA